MIDMNLYERIRQMDDEVLAMAEDFSQAFDAAGVCWGKGTVYGFRFPGSGFRKSLARRCLGAAGNAVDPMRRASAGAGKTKDRLAELLADES